MKLSVLDILVFAAYFVLVMLIGVMVAARSKTKGAKDYFLASKKLPWYTVGASYIAANISTEHFIGMVGWGFLYGMAVANWCWLAFVGFSISIGIFLPFYLRGNVSTMPEFLERRYNKLCRYVYAIVSIIGLVIALLGGVMFAGAKAFNALFPTVPIIYGILFLAIATGIYTIYGGLLSAAWADLMQYILLMVAGLVVAFFGLYYTDGFMPMIKAMPEKFIMFYGVDHEVIPWTGLIASMFSVGIWYNCANQFIIQRALGARSEWDAKMGVIMAGFSQAFIPLMVIIPGIIAFYLFHDQLSDGDQAWPYMVRNFLPGGLVGLVLAGFVAAILSTLSAINNSSATIFTLDLYHKLIRPQASDHDLKLVGRISGTVIMVIGVIIAILLALRPGITVFGLIQQVFFYMAAPIAAIFVVGIMWRGATSAGATAALLIGYAIIYPTVLVFPHIPGLKAYDSFPHHTFLVFIISIAILVVVSLFTQRKTNEELKGVIWTKAALGVPEHEKPLNRGLRNFKIWWAVMVICLISLYVIVISFSKNAIWLEAEKLPYTIAAAEVQLASSSNEIKPVQTPPSARIQPRKEMKGFNLWTGQSQVLFTAPAGGSITFEVPIRKAGRYELATVVTKGPEYGKFRMTIHGQPCEMSYLVTHMQNQGKRFVARTVKTGIFDGSWRPENDASVPNPEAIAGKHVVTRLDLGEHALPAGTVKITLEAVEPTATRPEMGIDQWILNRVGD